MTTSALDISGTRATTEAAEVCETRTLAVDGIERCMGWRDDVSSMWMKIYDDKFWLSIHSGEPENFPRAAVDKPL